MIVDAPVRTATKLQRFVLPGLALKAVVIGGGYATGRELAEYFVPAGPWGGLAAMLLAAFIWSLVAAITFALAHAIGAYDYRTFFRHLLGRSWILFEVAFLIFAILILAVFGAAAGAIGAATAGWPPVAGTVMLAVAILFATAFGSAALERVFIYVSLLIYSVYGVFLVVALSSFGDSILQGFVNAPPPSGDWMTGGITYASYNIVGAVIILPVLRHLTCKRDAVIAGIIAGPLTMLPAILFFVVMMAFYPSIGGEALPSDFLLRQMAVPGFHIIFQTMIFAALLESGAGALHAIHERIAHAAQSRERPAPGPAARTLIGAVILSGCMFIAARIGLVDLIAGGYSMLAWVFLAVYIVPLLTVGSYRLLCGQIQSPSNRIP